MNLRVEGQPVTAGKVTVGDWGELTVGASAVDTSAPAGTKGYKTAVTELDLRLTADHGGLPAGSEIQIGTASAAVQTAPRPTTTYDHDHDDRRDGHDRRRAVGRRLAEPAVHVPAARRSRSRSRCSRSSPPAATSSRSSAPRRTSTPSAPTRADVTYHHGDDIFGSLGQPLVACTDGIVFSVGFNKIGGNRLWIVDKAGNQFYYAHLSAFSTAALNGAHVKAGQVIGFMGDTGDAEGTPFHLHFEIHPVSFLYLGYDGAVDPTPYLNAWQHQQDLPFPIAGGWVPPIPGSARRRRSRARSCSGCTTSRPPTGSTRRRSSGRSRRSTARR